MLIVGYCFDIRSERRLCEEVRLNLAYRWFGVISAADLMQFNAQGRGPTSVRAWQLCTYKPISVGPDTPMGEVARLMVE